MVYYSRKEKIVIVKGFALDFDGTLAHFKGDLKGLFDIFLCRGVPANMVHDVYLKTEKDCFTIDRFTEYIKKSWQGPLFHENDIPKEFEIWLKNSLELYSDSHRMVTLWQRNAQVAIITFGDPTYQQAKVFATHIPHDLLYFCIERGGKAAAIKLFLEKCGAPVVFIDNNPAELDPIYEAFPREQVLTMRIYREDERDPNAQEKYPHIKVSSLQEAQEIIAKL